MPWFYVDDAFADSKPVMKLEERLRNEAVGLWLRCGAWSACRASQEVRCGTRRLSRRCVSQHTTVSPSASSPVRRNRSSSATYAVVTR